MRAILSRRGSYAGSSSPADTPSDRICDEPVYHTGDVMTVHWIVQQEAPTSATQSTQIDPSVKLSGPYGDLSGLKQRETGASSMAAVSSISAAPIVTSNLAGAHRRRVYSSRHRSARVLQPLSCSQVE